MSFKLQIHERNEAWRREHELLEHAASFRDRPGFDLMRYAGPDIAESGIRAGGELLLRFTQMLKPLAEWEDKPLYQLLLHFGFGADRVGHVTPVRVMECGTWSRYWFFLSRHGLWTVVLHQDHQYRLLDKLEIRIGLTSEEIVRMVYLDQNQHGQPPTEGDLVTTTPWNIVNGILMSCVRSAAGRRNEARRNKLEKWDATLKLIEKAGVISSPHTRG